LAPSWTLGEDNLIQFNMRLIAEHDTIANDDYKILVNHNNEIDGAAS
jgi:hypothetical protein